MGIIKVETPQGIVDVEIEGEEPTQEEQTALYNTFFSGGREAQVKTDIDLATASFEEVQEYVKQREALAIDPATGEKIEKDPTEEVGVDYVSGLRNFRIRAGLANKETTEERAAYLTAQVGSNGFRLDEKGRFILTKVGRKRLNLPEGPEIAIDEKGISRYDVADFIGQSGVPLTVGIGASLLTGGIGTVPAMAAVGVSMGVGKLLDEAFETAQGYQRESVGEIGKAAVVEGVFGAFGEGLGRFVSGALGRLFKGSASKQAEEAKAGGRELLEKGFRPTVEGGAPGTFGVLTRLQAIYEGISPNQKAAETNVKALMAELKRVSQTELGGVSDEAIENLGKVIKKDIEKIYTESDELLKNAQKIKNNEIEREVRKLIKPLRAGENLGLKEVKGLIASKALFSEAIDDLYLRVDSLLGQGQQIIPAGRLKKVVDDALDAADTKVEKEIRQSKIKQIIDNAEEEARKRLIASRRGTLGDDFTNEDIQREMFLTPSDANRIRTALTNMEYTGVPGVNFSKIRKTVDEAFFDARGILRKSIDTLKGQQEQPLSPNMLGQLGVDRFLADFGGGLANIEDLAKGLELLSSTQKLYAEGFKRLNQPVVVSLIQQTKRGRIKKDDQLLTNVIDKADAEDLRQLFLARKGVPVNIMRELGLREKPIMVRYAGEDIPLDEAEAAYAAMPSNNKNKVLFEAIKEGRKTKAARDTELGGEIDPDTGQRVGAGLQGERLRQRLASAWVSNLLKDKKVMNTIEGKRVFDGIKIANAIDDLGDKKAVLFGKDTQTVDELTTLLRTTGKEIDPEVIETFAASPLAQAVKGVKDATDRIQAVNKDEYLSALRGKKASKIAQTIFNKQDASMIRAFMKNDIELEVPGQNRTIRVKPFEDNPFSVDPVTNRTPHQQIIKDVQDAAMGRVLRSLGDVEDAQFADKFLSGSLGGKLKTSLDGYGRDTLEAMFGRQQTNDLYKLSEIMVRASDQPIKGKGGLAAPTIALGLSIFGLMTAPIATISALAFYKTMSTALRTPAVMNVLLSSRRPGEDAIGQALQSLNTISSQVVTQTAIKPAFEEGTRAASALPIPSALPQDNQQQTTVPNVTPPVAGTATRIDPTNPIVNPDPATQALAQRLAGTSAITR